MAAFSLNRRQTLALLSSTALVSLIPALPAAAQEGVVRLIVLSDLHSAYERSAQLFAAVESEIEAATTPVAILINGDVIELGNVVTVRSQAAIDWALLERFAALAPTVLNIGNHEPDIDNDLAHVITKATERGIDVVSNIIDKRTGKPYAPASLTLNLDDLPVGIVGIATAAINTYPAPTRELIDIPDPAQWARENLPGLLDTQDIKVVLSHAGITPDREILPIVPDGTLIVGGHDHVVLDHQQGATCYVHTGSWSSLFTVVEINAAGVLSVARREVDLNAPGDDDLARLIDGVLGEHLTDEERASIGISENALSLADSARFTAAAMASAAGGDIGFIGHTTFGTGFPKGDVSLYGFNSIVRFNGTLKSAEVSREVLEEILARANQDGDIPLERRTGDFLYAAPADLPQKESYRIVTNDWSALNQANYFGRDDLAFEDVPGLEVKPLVIEALH